MKIIHVIYRHGKEERNLEDMRYTLRELRARKGWTQKETAQKLGISEQTYNAWEKDVSGVAVSKVNALAKLFGVKIGEIFFE